MLNINMEFRKGILFVRFNGILNKDTSNCVKKEVNNLIKENGIKYLVFNLKGISFIDKVGMHILMDNYREIASINGKVVICGIEKIKDKINCNKYMFIYQSKNEIDSFKIINV